MEQTEQANLPIHNGVEVQLHLLHRVQAMRDVAEHFVVRLLGFGEVAPLEDAPQEAAQQSVKEVAHVVVLAIRAGVLQQQAENALEVKVLLLVGVISHSLGDGQSDLNKENAELGWNQGGNDVTNWTG